MGDPHAVMRRGILGGTSVECTTRFESFQVGVMDFIHQPSDNDGNPSRSGLGKQNLYPHSLNVCGLTQCGR